ncbi:MAG: ATP-binding cassette domain-containing protein [Methanomicrobiaceae archaeon]|nr:ATP-binding cassette domain-containing protein [Methanomicrobiaceae archaeon]
MTAVLEFDDVHFAYTNLPEALRGITFAVPKGRKVALVGANGAGKTTLLLMCNGMLKPTRGQVRLHGVPLANTTRALREIRKKVGLVFQNSDMQLFAPTVYQDVAFGPLNLGVEHDAIRRIVAASLTAVGLSGFEKRTPHQLSGGEKKRVAIAGILAMEPDVLIFDEPTSSLDPASAEEIMDLLDELNHDGKTIIISTHDVEMAYRWAHDVILMKEGYILCHGPPDEVFHNADLLQEARLKPPVILELFRELSHRGMLDGSQSPKGILEVTDILENTFMRTVSSPVEGSISVCDVGISPRGEILQSVREPGIGFVGAMGTKAKQIIEEERITPDFTYGVIDKCILRALVGGHSLILTSGGMVDHVLQRIRAYGEESGKTIPCLVLPPEKS